MYHNETFLLDLRTIFFSLFTGIIYSTTDWCGCCQSHARVVEGLLGRVAGIWSSRLSQTIQASDVWFPWLSAPVLQFSETIFRSEGASGTFIFTVIYNV
uniref:Uncharacterized protein n=1 Tax=Anguilla anguilla TaxID=7936 RepID=A0A0E9WIM3_ANGAN